MSFGSATEHSVFDCTVAAIGLVVLSPFLLAAAAAVVLESGWPFLFRQTRVGRGGRPFQLAKFRSMRRAAPGRSITAGDDPRVTRVGRFLRRYKIDELPQLWNVLKGDMSLVGPRPEVPQFVDIADPVWQSLLLVKPGITDLASLVHRHEEEILAGTADPERYYRDVVLPAKLALNFYYLQNRNFWRDLKLIMLTARYSLLPAGFDPDRVRRMFVYPEAA